MVRLVGVCSGSGCGLVVLGHFCIVAAALLHCIEQSGSSDRRMESIDMASRDQLYRLVGLPASGARVASTAAGAVGRWRCSNRVALAVPDATRKLNLAAALAAVESCLENPTVIIGLGLHRSMTDAELAPIASWHPIQHDPDACAPLTKNGIQIGKISQTIADAEWSLSIGVVELHQYAGYSGGHKGVAVGCGGRDTILQLHSRESIRAAGVEVGRINGNPFRQRIEELGEAARCYLALIMSRQQNAGFW